MTGLTIFRRSLLTSSYLAKRAPLEEADTKYSESRDWSATSGVWLRYNIE